MAPLRPPPRAGGPSRLLLEVLDGALATQVHEVRVEPELLTRAALAQQVPVAVELHAQVLQALVLLGRQSVARTSRIHQPVLLGHELLDVGLY